MLMVFVLVCLPRKITQEVQREWMRSEPSFEFAPQQIVKYTMRRTANVSTR